MLQFSSEKGPWGDRFMKGVGVCLNMWWVCWEVGGMWKYCRWEDRHVFRNYRETIDILTVQQMMGD